MDNWAVMECRVNLGDEKTYIAKNVHGAWAGINKPFVEYCLKDENKCNVIAKFVENGEFTIISEKAISRRVVVRQLNSTIKTICNSCLCKSIICLLYVGLFIVQGMFVYFMFIKQLINTKF